MGVHWRRVGANKFHVQSFRRNLFLQAQRPEDALDGEAAGGFITEGVRAAGAGVYHTSGRFRDNHGGLDFGQVRLVWENLQRFPEHERLEIVTVLPRLLEQNV